MIAIALLLILSQQPGTLRFDYKLPNAAPAEYSITVDESGKGSFEEPATDKQSAYHTDFQLASGLTERLFDQARAAHYFSGEYNYTRHKVANTGEKKLTYTSATQRGTAAFNFSEDPHIQDLTGCFQAVAATQDFARRVEFDRRFDKLALDAEVKSFAAEAAAHRALALDSIRSILQSLADDPTVLKTVRQRARELIGEADAAH